jgi:hypothetical protein
MSYVDDYVSRLNAIRAARTGPISFSGPPVGGASRSDLANLILQKAHSEFKFDPVDTGKSGTKDDRGIWGHVKSVGQGVLDILSRPLYGLAEGVDEVVNEDPHDPLGFFKGVGQGVSGKEKTDFIDVLKSGMKNYSRSPQAKEAEARGDYEAAAAYDKSWKEGMDKSKLLSVAGLVGDLVLDPVNYIPGAVMAAPFKLAKNGLKVDAALKASEEALGLPSSLKGAAEAGSEAARIGQAAPEGDLFAGLRGGINEGSKLPPALVAPNGPDIAAITSPLPVAQRSASVPFPRSTVPNLPEFVTETTSKNVERMLPGGLAEVKPASKARQALTNIPVPAVPLTKTAAKEGSLAETTPDLLKMAEGVVNARKIRMRNGLPPVMTPHEAAFADIWDNIAGATGRAKADLSHFTPQRLALELSDENAGIRLTKKSSEGKLVSGPNVSLKAIHDYIVSGANEEKLGDLFVTYKGAKHSLKSIRNAAESESRSGEYLLKVKSERARYARADPAKDPTGRGLQNLLRGVADYELKPARYGQREINNPEFFKGFKPVETALRKRKVPEEVVSDVRDAWADAVAANKGKPLDHAKFLRVVENAIDEYDPSILGDKSVLELMPPKAVKETVTQERKIYPDEKFGSILDSLRNDDRFIDLPHVIAGDISSSKYALAQKAKVTDEAAALVEEAGQGSADALKAIAPPVAKAISPDEVGIVTKVVDKTIDAIRKSSPVKSAHNPRPRHKAYNAPKQSNLSNMLANEAANALQKANPKIKAPHSPKFIPALYGSYTRMLRHAEDALIATGKDINMPRLGNGATGAYIRLSDVLDRLGPKLGRQAIFGPKGKVLVTKLLNAISGDKASLDALKASNREIYDEVVLTDWTDLMSRDYALRTIADTNKAKAVVDDASDAITAKATDPYLSESAKQADIQNVKQGVAKELADSMPETKRSMSDLLTKISENVKNINHDPRLNIADDIIMRKKQKLLDGVLHKHSKVAQTARLETVKAEGEIIAEGALNSAKYDPVLAAKLADANIFSNVLKWFKPDFGYKQLRPLLLKNVGVRKASAAVRAHDIRNIFKDVPVERHSELWDIATDRIPAPKDLELPAMTIKKVMGNMLIESGLKDAMAGNTAVARSGIPIDSLNRHLKIAGIDGFKFSDVQVDEITKAATKLDGLDILDSWKYAKPKNPQEFMFRVSQAVENSMVEYSAWANVGAIFGSAKAGKNTVQVAGMHPAINGMHFEPEIAQELSRMADGIDQIYEPLSTNKFLKMYDEALRTWKSGVTIYAPSHHIRNLIGDMYMSWLDGVNNPKYYSRAGKIIMANKNRYSDVIGSDKLPMGQLLGAGREHEIINELMLQGAKAPKGSHIMATAKVGRRQYKITANQVYQMGFRHGLFPHSNIIEDLPGSETLLEGLSSRYPGAKKIFQPLGGKGQRAAREISESREHLARIAHYLHAIEHTKADSLDDLFYKAAARVRKYHPDGLDLTRAEKTVMRRLFPFYSWTRKAIPLILEGVVTTPHKIMAYPKIMHGIAESQGITNTDISEPYPEDQLFPDWLSGNVIGPVFDPKSEMAKFFARSPGEEGYVIANPGNPATDIMEDYFNNPAKGILGSLTPGIKMPMEMLSGTDMQTGGPINDKTEYIDKNVPMLSVLSRLTNGAIGSGLVEGGDLKGKETDPVNQAGLINFLTAAGILDTGRYIKGGEFDLREYLRKKNAGANAGG